METGANTALVVGVAVGTILLGCGGYYYFRRKAKAK
jgi:LPXTG-motif cell wall-anchored protein